MKITFDPIKDQANFAKHGVSLAEAAHFEWDTSISWGDTRFSYDEQRFSAIGYIGLRIYYVAFTEKNEQYRIISLRRATAREVKQYAST